MGVPETLLAEAAELQGPLELVRNAFDEVLSACRDPDSELSVERAKADLDGAAELWHERSEQLKARLDTYRQQHPSDQLDAAVRIAGLSMLDIAVASDLALLGALDDASDNELVRNVIDIGALPEHPERGPSITATADGQALIRLLREPFVDYAADNAADRLDDMIVDDTIRDLVDRAGRSVSAVVFGLGGGLALRAVKGVLGSASSVLPRDLIAGIHQAAHAVKYWVAKLVLAAARWLHRILGVAAFDATKRIIDGLEPESLVAETSAKTVVGELLGAEGVRLTTLNNLRPLNDYELRHRLHRIMNLKNTNRHWVGPAWVVAHGLPALAPTYIAGVPAAPVAGAGLIAWALLVTGDQLDAEPPFPDIWKGVVRRSAGE